MTASGRKSIPTKIFTIETPKETKQPKEAKQSKESTPRAQLKRDAKRSNPRWDLGSIVEMELDDGIPFRCTVDFNIDDEVVQMSFSRNQVRIILWLYATFSVFFYRNL